MPWRHFISPVMKENYYEQRWKKFKKQAIDDFGDENDIKY